MRIKSKLYKQSTNLFGFPQVCKFSSHSFNYLFVSVCLYGDLLNKMTVLIVHKVGSLLMLYRADIQYYTALLLGSPYIGR